MSDTHLVYYHYYSPEIKSRYKNLADFEDMLFCEVLHNLDRRLGHQDYVIFCDFEELSYDTPENAFPKGRVHCRIEKSVGTSY